MQVTHAMMPRQRHNTIMKKEASIHDKGIWLHDGSSDMNAVPQELKDWAALPEHKLDDPFSRLWYRMPVRHIGFALKRMRRRIHGYDEINDHPVPQKRFRNPADGLYYYIGQDPETKSILWGMEEA